MSAKLYITVFPHVGASRDATYLYPCVHQPVLVHHPFSPVYCLRRDKYTEADILKHLSLFQGSVVAGKRAGANPSPSEQTEAR